MTTYGAYDMGLPCKNASCKSHGKPHPNCRCYGAGLAKGGSVKSFCAANNPHDPGCEYYADGGSVGPVGNLQQADPNESASAYISHGGLHSLIKMDDLVDKYDRSVKKGHKAIDGSIEGMFGGNAAEKRDLGSAKESINEWMDKGGIDHDVQQEIYRQNAPQSFAHGGHVSQEPGLLSPKPIEHVYPDQHAMLSLAKGRASGYLNSLRPQKHGPKLAFDEDIKDHSKERAYEKAVDIAAHPLSILDHIRKGTVEPEQVKHLNSMYPELGDHLQKRITERVIKAQLDGKKPSYKVRQGLSLLMGTPLSSEMTPQNIMAAQATFQSQKPPMPQGGNSGSSPKKTSALTKTAQSHLTTDDALVSRQQKQKS